ncbi:MAG: hypothetical protein D3M94_03330 [Rhodocyclales bacterium GT-UBC]|nr:MAG: hypothetical protein D3M94_03330 [Rhodocyclales bacterium GT-UBC]
MSVALLKYFLLALLIQVFAAAFMSPVHAGTWSRIFLDGKGHAFLVKADGKMLRVSKHGRALNPKLAPDGETAAWLLVGRGGEGAADASELAVYRHGRIRKIRCDPLIREYWFWQNGSYLVLDCGGRHFAGRNVLYEIASLRQVESVDQAKLPVEQRPAWANE